MARRMQGETCFYCRQTFADMHSLYRHRKGSTFGRWCAK
jgi:hypothetical protein